MDRLNQFRCINDKRKIRLLLVALILVTGCSGTQQVMVQEYADGGYYKNHVNSQLIRDQIKEGFESVVRIQNNVIYRTYQFYTDDMPLESQVRGQDLEEISIESYIDDRSTAGTAIVVSDYRGKYALLTASHTVFYPDTVWHYYDDSVNSTDMEVEAVSVKQSINHFVLMERGIIRLEIVAIDTRRDLAIMTNTNRNGNGLMSSLALPLGNSDRLDWGDIVYAMGYPKGAKMVTLGIVSRNDHPTRSIIIDASFNRGFSGGAIFSVRNDGSGLEWMGLVTSALGENETYLVPELAETEEFNPEIPYKGDVYVRTTPRINYGITNAVGINEIQDFFNENENRINDMGITLP